MRLYCNDAAMGTARLPECGGEPLSGLFATYECRGQRSFIRRGWAHQWYQIEERREYPRTIGDRCGWQRSEEHTSELQSLMRISYAVFCLKKKNKKETNRQISTKEQNNNIQESYLTNVTSQTQLDEYKK